MQWRGMRRVSAFAAIGIVLGGLMLLLAGCGHQAPQIPSQRKSNAPTVDSAQLALLQLNQQLAESADEAVWQAVQAQPESYALYEGNVWACILDAGDTDSPAPREGEEQVVRMRVSTLDGRLLEDSEGTYRIGKQELPKAIDANISEWHHGARVKIYAPWYAAFGITGTHAVPPYENVIIEIDIR